MKMFLAWYFFVGAAAGFAFDLLQLNASGVGGGFFWPVLRFRVSVTDWIPIILLLLLAVPSFIPYEAWEEFIVRVAGPGSHGSDFLVQAAAHDKRP
jgi:hypothetical protein